MSKFLSTARDMQKKMSKTKKGKVQFTKALVIYREKFQDFQIEILKLLRGCIVDGNIRADWRNEVKIENKEDKTKALKFGGFVADLHKIYGDQVLDENLFFDERRTL